METTKKVEKMESFKMVQAKHLHSTLEAYITTWRDTYRERVGEIVSNIDEVAKIDPENSSNMLVNMAKMRVIEKQTLTLQGIERKVKKNFVTSTFNLIGLNKIQGINLQSIKKQMV